MIANKTPEIVVDKAIPILAAVKNPKPKSAVPVVSEEMTKRNPDVIFNTKGSVISIQNFIFPILLI